MIKTTPPTTLESASLKIDSQTTSPHIDEQELRKFASLAEDWWNTKGDMKPLHQMNPARIAFIRDRIGAHFDLEGKGLKPLAGIRICDVGCGGGLASEALARLGASVTGIDASGKNIPIARHHAQQMGLDIDYRHAMVEDLAASGVTFDVVICLEVLEHVRVPAGFVRALAQLTRPGGLVLTSTLNKTAKSYALAILAGEYILRLVPRGTHDWKKFIRPSALALWFEDAGLEITDIRGFVYNPLSQDWHTSKDDLDVNYFLEAVRPQTQTSRSSSKK